jgi:hypothetical protein
MKGLDPPFRTIKSSFIDHNSFIEDAPIHDIKPSLNVQIMGSIVKIPKCVPPKTLQSLEPVLWVIFLLVREVLLQGRLQQVLQLLLPQVWVLPEVPLLLLPRALLWPKPLSLINIVKEKKILSAKMVQNYYTFKNM